MNETQIVRVGENYYKVTGCKYSTLEEGIAFDAVYDEDGKNVRSHITSLECEELNEVLMDEYEYWVECQNAKYYEGLAEDQ